MGSNIEFKLTYTQTGQLTALARSNAAEYRYLHSSVDPVEEAEEWAKRIEKQPRSLFLVLGLGLGYHVDALLRHVSQDSCIIIIHTPEEFSMLQKINKKKIRLRFPTDSRVRNLILTHLSDMSVIIGDHMLKKKVRRITICKHYPTMTLAPAAYEAIECDAVQHIENAMSLNCNISITSSVLHFRNYWSNVPYILKHQSATVLQRRFVGYSVIIVSSGPSLNKNIHILRECQGKAIIIAASTAIGALAKAGIKPDFLVICDPQPALYDCLKDFFSVEVPLVIRTEASGKVVENYPGEMYFFHPKVVSVFGIEDKLLEIPRIRSSISVATAAVDFAVYCGAKQIILIGQDLAYGDNGENYAQGVRGGGDRDHEYIKVPGYYGGEVLTNRIFRTVIEYFGLYVQKHPEIEFINATEGGALLAAMENIPLEAVMKNILPSQNINKDFATSSSSISRKNVRKILLFFQNAMVEAQRMTNSINAFFEVNKLQSNDNNEAHVKKYHELFQHITIQPGYDFVKSVVEPRLQFLELSRDEGISFDVECSFFQSLLELLKELLTEFIQLLEISLNTLTNLEERAK